MRSKQQPTRLQQPNVQPQQAAAQGGQPGSAAEDPTATPECPAPCSQPLQQAGPSEGGPPLPEGPASSGLEVQAAGEGSGGRQPAPEVGEECGGRAGGGQGAFAQGAVGAAPAWQEHRHQGTGRGHGRAWTEQEEALFLEALELYGRDWRKGAEHVGTRDYKAFASHAQKHFIKLMLRGKELPAKVAESGLGYTVSGKPLDPNSATALANGVTSKRFKAARESGRLEVGIHVTTLDIDEEAVASRRRASKAKQPRPDPQQHRSGSPAMACLHPAGAGAAGAAASVAANPAGSIEPQAKRQCPAGTWGGFCVLGQKTDEEEEEGREEGGQGSKARLGQSSLGAAQALPVLQAGNGPELTAEQVAEKLEKKREALRTHLAMALALSEEDLDCAMDGIQIYVMSQNGKRLDMGYRVPGCPKALRSFKQVASHLEKELLPAGAGPAGAGPAGAGPAGAGPAGAGPAGAGASGSGSDGGGSGEGGGEAPPLGEAAAGAAVVGEGLGGWTESEAGEGPGGSASGGGAVAVAVAAEGGSGAAVGGQQQQGQQQRQQQQQGQQQWQAEPLRGVNGPDSTLARAARAAMAAAAAAVAAAGAAGSTAFAEGSVTTGMGPEQAAVPAGGTGTAPGSDTGAAPGSGTDAAPAPAPGPPGGPSPSLVEQLVGLPRNEAARAAGITGKLVGRFAGALTGFSAERRAEAEALLLPWLEWGEFDSVLGLMESTVGRL